MIPQKRPYCQSHSPNKIICIIVILLMEWKQLEVFVVYSIYFTTMWNSMTYASVFEQVRSSSSLYVMQKMILIFRYSTYYVVSANRCITANKRFIFTSFAFVGSICYVTFCKMEIYSCLQSVSSGVDSIVFPKHAHKYIPLHPLNVAFH